VFVVVTQFVDESAKTKRLARVLFSIYLGGRIIIILQKQLSKSVQICKLFSRLEGFFPVSFFWCWRRKEGGGGGRAWRRRRRRFCFCQTIAPLHKFTCLRISATWKIVVD
jgi:hypothetical protein